MCLGYPLFWFVALRSLVCYRVFLAAYRSHFQGPTYKIQYFSIHFSPKYETEFCKNPRFVCFLSDGSNIEMKIGMEHWWIITDRGQTDVLEEKPVTVPLCPPQILYVLSWDRKRISAVRGRQLRTSLNNRVTICIQGYS